jgi:hypothetical protein
MERNEFSKFLPIVAQLDPTAQSFFQNQFLKKEFASTRQQIARRLYSVLSVPSFDRMFSTKENKLDMFECIQSRKIVLINTRKALLKTDACALFGRYMIAQTMAAAFERAAIQHRPPAYLIVDEFGDYADDSMESLLTQARKYNLGVLFAHQAMSQLSPSLQSIIAANTSIKVAGGLSDRDARALAADMRTTTDFFTNLKKTDHSAQFGAFIRNKTGKAVTIDVPFGVLESEPRMTEAQHKALIARNTARYSASATPEHIVNFNPRPPEMEPWRLEKPKPSQFQNAWTASADKPKSPANDEDPKPSKDY